MLFLVLLHVITCVNGLTQLLIIGGTGNLAQKYLWPSLNELQHNHELELWAAGTEELAIGKNRLAEIVPNSLHVEYIKLMHARDYENLLLNSNWKMDASLIVYLAIPPKFFAHTCEMVHQYLQSQERPWLRIVVEKPFGHDFESASALAKTIETHFDQNQIFLIDHYLGKRSIQGLKSFLVANSQIWTQVKHIDINMREIESCVGRTGYFEGVGIIRDVMVNHLTLILATLSSPSNWATRMDITDNLLLQKVPFIALGQYSMYSIHANTTSTTTTTAASVKFQHQNLKQSVQISAGKAFAGRKTQIHLHLQTNDCIISITIQNGAMEDIQVKLCSELADLIVKPQGWVWKFKRELEPNRHGILQISAYQFLLDKVILGEHRHFMTISEILQAWKMWMPVLKISDEVKHNKLVVYNEGTEDDSFLDMTMLEHEEL
uniref:glucose-6-phosphate dehydrogenase (NADP(+)) n=1 Tax=Thraustotheca clavata TaxID=74557 RepID=A0A0A7CLV3_9STRA|nr:secreted protein [Thraustotheca clavata]